MHVEVPTPLDFLECVRCVLEDILALLLLALSPKVVQAPAEVIIPDSELSERPYLVVRRRMQDQMNNLLLGSMDIPVKVSNISLFHVCE